MKKQVLFLHGMGVEDADWIRRHTRLLSTRTDCEFLPLSYAEAVNKMGLIALAEEKNREEPDVERIAFAEGFIAAELAIEEPPGVLRPLGDQIEDARTSAYNVYKYAIRYFLRRRLHAAVYDTVYRQTQAHIGQHPRGTAFTLLAHSLGCVVALDLMTDRTIAGNFGKMITVGSPIGLVAKVPVAGNHFVPASSRSVDVRWVDVAAPDDLVAKVRISNEMGFSGKELEVVRLKTGYESPHSAYFYDESAVSEWSTYLS